MQPALAPFTLALVLWAALPSARAGEIYRWTDESGRVHLSDNVPERFKAKAQRIDTRQFELSDTQRAEADARAERERAAQAQAAARRAAEAASAPPPAASANARKPAVPAATDCDSLWQQYRESQECFAPYQRRDRGTNPEAFKQCSVVESPSQKCGPPKW